MSLSNSRSLLTLVILGAIVVAPIILVQSAGQNDTTPKSKGFGLHKIIDFNQFKHAFNKSYTSVVQELSRQKLFLARAFRAFVSAVSFKHKLSSFYLRVNQMSDWTPEEMKKTSIKPEVYYQSMMNLADVAVDGDDEAKLLANMAKQSLGQLNDRTIGQKSSTDELKVVDMTRGGKLADIYENPNVKDAYKEVAEALREDSEGSVGGEKAASWSEYAMNGLQLGVHLMEMAMTRGFMMATARIPEKNDLPDEVFHDHRESNCLNSIRDQGICGSCYIFSTISLYEWAYCHKYGDKIKFSEQYVIDCGNKTGLAGCDGGIEPLVGKFVQQYGFELLDRYKYKGSDGQCPYGAEDFERNSPGFVRLDQPRMRLVPFNSFEEQLKKSPILFGIRTGNDFFEYGGGLHQPECGPRDDLHSVLIVGSGRENGYEYWLIKNSYGYYWGEKGYYKLKKDSQCYSRLSYGLTLDVFRRGFLPVVLGENLPPLFNVYEPQGVYPYNFSGNPQYDWRILAKKFGHKSPPQEPWKRGSQNDTNDI